MRGGALTHQRAEGPQYGSRWLSGAKPPGIVSSHIQRPGRGAVIRAFHPRDLLSGSLSFHGDCAPAGAHVVGGTIPVVSLRSTTGYSTARLRRGSPRIAAGILLVL